MKRNTVLQGIACGFMAGVIVTVIDGFFMLRPNMYTPPEYPAVLVLFNVILWTVVGCLSGILAEFFIRRSSHATDALFYRVLFFLVPFAGLYGILGKFYTPHMEVIVRNRQQTFDYHLSFIWVGCFILFLLVHALRQKPRSSFPSSLFFFPELLVIIALFQFCSNPESLRMITLAKRIQSDGGVFFAAVFYALGVAAIFALYWWYFCKMRSKFAELLLRNRLAVSLAGVMLCGIVYALTARAATSETYLVRTVPLIDAPVLKQGSAGKRPNVILIVFDTLRAASVRALEGSGFISNIESFADDSMVFENCVAASYFTFPSHASIFTGVYPPEHGCEKIESDHFLADEFITIAERFKGYGYTTAAIASNFAWLNEDFNMLQGFEYISSLKNIGSNHKLPFRPTLNFFSYVSNIYNKSTLSCRTADDINKTALAVTEKIAQSPFFLFLNYMDVHTPYRPPSPYDDYFLDQPNPHLYRLQQYYLKYREKGIKESWDSYLLSQYWGELAYLDIEFGNFVKRLKEMGLYDSSLIIVTSDHGEVFGKHGYYSHYSPMHEGIAKLPLFIKYPMQEETGSTDRIINLVDLYPTILSICGMPVPDDISGVAFGDEKTSGFAGVTGTMIYYKDAYKYMDAFEENGSDLLFHLSTDPEEMNDLSETSPEIFNGLKQARDSLSEIYTLRYVAQSHPMSEDVKDGLRSLGYIQ